MQMNVDLDKVAASREHALAMTRDYISQPRLSKYSMVQVAYTRKCTGN